MSNFTVKSITNAPSILLRARKTDDAEPANFYEGRVYRAYTKADHVLIDGEIAVTEIDYDQAMVDFELLFGPESTTGPSAEYAVWGKLNAIQQYVVMQKAHELRESSDLFDAWSQAIDHVLGLAADAARIDDEAISNYLESEKSFDRSDTDGFLSQWANNIVGRRKQYQAELLRDGGYSYFPGLYDRETGERVKAKLISGRYGLCWAFCDESGEFTGEFISYNADNSKRSKQYKLGYWVKDELAPGYAKVHSSGRGLSGATSAVVITIRLGKGF